MRYPTLRCERCQQMRCFPGGSTTCHEWPGSECAPPALSYTPIKTSDGKHWWDRDAGTWRAYD